MTIGIPRALIYWKRPDFWQSFFENLGCDVLLSPKTNKEIIEKGVKSADPETCFSFKVFFGHLLWLDEKCDFVFVPCLKTNKEKLEYCPKFFGLPDLAKILTKTPILTETFDERKEKFAKTLKKLGKKLNKNQKQITEAAKNAFLTEEQIKEKQKQNFLTKIKSKKRKIVLVSHPYNLYDDYVNLRTKEKLEKLGAEVIFIDEIPIDETPIDETRPQPISNGLGRPALIKGLWRNPNIEFHWEFAKEIMEKVQAILSYSANCGIVGAIEISSFQCGCDAVLKEFVEKEFKQRKIPFLYLIIDEQTGEAGLQTRLEAFMDTIKY